MLPVGTPIQTNAPGQWSVGRTPDGLPAVISSFPAKEQDAVWQQLERWCSALLSIEDDAVRAPVPLRLPDGVPRLAYPVPWRVGLDGFVGDFAGARVLSVLRAVAATLDRLHAQNVVHGGLGLASIWWESAERIEIPDIALAHTLDGLVPAPAASSAYHAPEVWRGQPHVFASDQYALAVIAHELFTGRQRVPASNVEGLAAFEPISIDATLPLFKGASRGVADVMRRALAATPSARYPSCTEFIEALSGHIAPVQSERTVHPRFGRIRQRLTLRGVGLGVAAIGAIAIAAYVSRSPVSSKRVARSITERLPDVVNAEMMLPTSGGGLPSSSMPSVRRNTATVPSTAPTSIDASAAASTAPTSNSTVETPLDAAGASIAATQPSPARTTRGVASSSSGAAASANNAARVPLRAASSAALSLEANKLLERDRASLAPSSFGERITAAVRSAARSVLGSGSSVAASGAAMALDNQRVTEPARVDQTSQVGSSTLLSSSIDAARSPTTEREAPPVASAPSSAEFGVIRLDVPANSRIYLDGVLLSGSPRAVPTSAGTHDVDVIVPGSSQTQRRRVSVSATDTSIVRIRP